MSYTAQQVSDAIKAQAEDWGYSGYQISQGTFWLEIGGPEVVPGIDGVIETVETRGGEGQGDQYVVVLKLTTTDDEVQYFRIDGYYSSYDGVDFSYADLYEVRPREKTIITYEAV
jgi:hypothetical protein